MTSVGMGMEGVKYDWVVIRGRRVAFYCFKIDKKMEVMKVRKREFIVATRIRNEGSGEE